MSEIRQANSNKLPASKFPNTLVTILRQLVPVLELIISHLFMHFQIIFICCT